MTKIAETPGPLTDSEIAELRRRALTRPVRGMRVSTADDIKADAERRGLPTVAREPEPVIKQGERYVICDQRVFAFDGKAIYLAAVPGMRLRESYARKLGVDREAQVLSWRSA